MKESGHRDLWTYYVDIVFVTVIFDHEEMDHLAQSLTNMTQFCLLFLYTNIIPK